MQNVNKSYKMGSGSLHVLKDISLTVEQGEYLAILGPSGSGKSTLMNIIGCMDVLDEGTYNLDGVEIEKAKEKELTNIRNQKIGFIFQNYLLMPELTALENACLASSIGKRPRMEYVTELMDRVGLSHRLNHLPGELSGGEQQRVAIARALANDAPIIFADEPTGNLDRKNGAEVLDLLFGLADESRKTLVIVTHDEHLARRGDRIITIMDGQAV